MGMYDDMAEHVRAPRNVGEPAGANAEAEDENPVCGDQLHVWLRVEGERIKAMGWEARGCAPAVAAASATSELVTGMSLAEAREVDRDRVAEALGGLPARKMHGAMLAVSTLRKAIEDFARRRDSQ